MSAANHPSLAALRDAHQSALALCNLAVEAFGGWMKVHERPEQYGPLVIALMRVSSERLTAAVMNQQTEALRGIHRALIEQSAATRDAAAVKGAAIAGLAQEVGAGFDGLSRVAAELPGAMAGAAGTQAMALEDLAARMGPAMETLAATLGLALDE